MRTFTHFPYGLFPVFLLLGFGNRLKRRWYTITPYGPVADPPPPCWARQSPSPLQPRPSSWGWSTTRAARPGHLHLFNCRRDRGEASLAGNQITFTPSAAGTGTVTYIATDSIGVVSDPVDLTTTTILAQPVITLQPTSQTIASGRSVVFGVMATGSPAPTYQWTLDGSPAIPGTAVTTDPILFVSGRPWPMRALMPAP